MVKRKSWQRYEKTTAKKHRGKHLGGPGQPDYLRGDTEGEVKLRQRPLTKTEVMEECRKGRNEIVCNAGFSEAAEEYIRSVNRQHKWATYGTKDNGHLGLAPALWKK